MYNENIKNRYIENKESEVIVPKGYLQNCFKKSEPFEEELGKDISNFTAYEINNFFKTLNISSYESLLVLCNSFQQYTQWCLQQNLVKDSQNHFLEFDKDDLIACLNKIAMQNKIIPKETIYRWCNELVNYGDSFAIIALFEGLKGKNYCEIVNAKIEDLNTKKKTFKTCTGRIIPVSDKFIELAINSDKELNYLAITGMEQRQTKLIDNGLIIKDYPNVKDGVSEFIKGRRLYNRALRMFDFLGVADWCSFNAIYGSGLVSFIQEEMTKYNVDIETFLASKEMRKETENKYGITVQKYLIYQKYPMLFKNN